MWRRWQRSRVSRERRKGLGEEGRGGNGVEVGERRKVKHGRKREEGKGKGKGKDYERERGRRAQGMIGTRCRKGEESVTLWWPILVTFELARLVTPQK